MTSAVKVILITVASLVWLFIGVQQVRRHERGWLAMMTDTANVRFTWLSLPALLLCWVCWPCRSMSRYCFLTVHFLGL
jgi:hypothetical protein